MHRAPLYWTVIAITFVFGAEAALAQGAINNPSAAICPSSYKLEQHLI
ncbi:MAG: hypothetical protein ACKVG0_10375 [Alphaproteobacteria bacterium]|jgi:hypothetical protein